MDYVVIKKLLQESVLDCFQSHLFVGSLLTENRLIIYCISLNVFTIHAVRAATFDI